MPPPETPPEMPPPETPPEMPPPETPPPETPPPEAPATAAVSVMDDVFSPASVTIRTGGTVTWTWRSSNLHTVTSNTGAFDSGTPQSSGTFSHTFATAGSYPYHCEVHGLSMSGTVTVQ
jgi:plastocyanin